MERQEAIAQLARNQIARRSDFAASLVQQYYRKGRLSNKQWYWVFKLIETPEPKITETVDATRIIELFEEAKKSRKYPKVVAANDAITLRFTMAGERAGFPGSINLIDNDTREWLGRIHTNGNVQFTRRADAETVRRATSLVRDFAQDPVAVARRSGHITGECCFCSKGLTDDRSRHAGYGPVCAKRFGLEWGGDLSKDVDSAGKVWFAEQDGQYQIVNIDSVVGEVNGELAWVQQGNAAALSFETQDDAKTEWAWAKLNG